MDEFLKKNELIMEFENHKLGSFDHKIKIAHEFQKYVM
jgi:hypothetical protein